MGIRLAKASALIAAAAAGSAGLTVSTASPSQAHMPALLAATSGDGASPALTGHGHPNTLIVMTDDMRRDEMRYLPRTRAWLSGRGTTFTNAYSPTPLCCPARASLLTGQYAHNTGVYTNRNGGPFPGGISGFDDSRTIPTVLNRQLGNRNITTGYIGKYLNGYKAGRDGEVRGTYVPPGWDVWRASIAGEYRYTGRTTYSFNGRYVDISGYETTVQTDLAASFIKKNSGSKPWMLLLNYFAPHNAVESHRNVPVPEAAHAHRYDGARAPRGPAYNEPDMSDKPPVAQRSRMSGDERRYTDNLAEARYEALASVDDGMMRLRRTLRASGVASDTNIIFLSDNGYLLGDHRVRHNKVYGYEPSAKIPMLVSGSGFAGGRKNAALVGVHDIASTVTGIYRLGAMPQADGVSLTAIANGHARDRDLLLRGVFGSQRNNYTAIRTPNSWKYIEYAAGGSELYNLRSDPAEVESLAGRPRYTDLQAELSHRLRALRACAGETCR